MAIIESAESSNRIEGVTVDRKRLHPLVIGNTRPRDRSEEEIVGYRMALTWIHTDSHKIPVTPETCLRLHALAQGGTSGDAGKLLRLRLFDPGYHGMLDFSFNDRMLLLCKRLCRYYFNIDPKVTVSHIDAYREMWDEKSLTGGLKRMPDTRRPAGDFSILHIENLEVINH